MPITLLLSALESIELVQEEGNVISNAPKKEIPKTRNKAKTKMLNAALLAKSFANPAFRVRPNMKPIMAKISMIESE